MADVSRKGIVYWFTGLAGSGKSTLGTLFFSNLKKSDRHAVYLDGDTLREVFGNDLGYGAEDRKKSAMRNSRLCKLLSDQGVDVVCATISMFHVCRRWNRDNIENYREIYIRAPMDVLMARNQKGIYGSAHQPGSDPVAGLTLEVEEPESPDVVLDNDGTVSPEILVNRLASRLAGPVT